MRGIFKRKLEPYRVYGESLSAENNEAGEDPGLAPRILRRRRPQYGGWLWKAAVEEVLRHHDTYE